MSRKSKTAVAPVVIHSDVLREIRQHARSQSKTEVCGVLIGSESHGVIEIEAGIQGVNAEQAGAHVTFTQDTWEHIYKIKDRDYPDDRILGWYHSHPGFGVFLSDHDTFIHKNFFSSPGQVAWVYDPHSDEEGCFGWVDGRIKRLPNISVVDLRGGQLAESSRPEPVMSGTVDDEETEIQVQVARSYAPRNDDNEMSNETWLKQLTMMIVSYLSILALGFALSWYFFPRVEIVGVPFDPMTGQPLVDLAALGLQPKQVLPATTQKQQDSASPQPPAKPDPNPRKGQHEQRQQ